jgi:hypothetical protein
VTEAFWTAVYRIMLGTCMSLEILVVVALHSEDILYSQDGVKIWVLSV